MITTKKTIAMDLVISMFKDGRIDKAEAGQLLKGLNSQKTPVAIVGMGWKSPLSDNYNDIWDVISNKRTLIQACPKDRITRAAQLLAGLDTDERNYHYGAILSDIDQFDYELFGISHEDASLMEPSHRIMLQAAYRALEDAGYLSTDRRNEITGVYIAANFTANQIVNYLKHIGDINMKSYMLNWTSFLATRLSNQFDLRGPSTVIENSCVSAALALYEACNLLEMGKITSALVGGINISHLLDKRIVLNEVFHHAPDIASKSFDDEPGGNYVGEGAIALFLKPLDKAVADQDRIHGIIRGIDTNNSGGAAIDFLQTSSEMITQVVQGALIDANLRAEDITYVDGEGYCERIEQALEVKGLINGFQTSTQKKQYCALGLSSVNLGYSEAMLGLSNAVCCVLALKNKQIPPVYKFDTPSSYLDFINSPFYINDKLKDWEVEEGKKRIAASFSCGYGGGNALTIFEEYIPDEQNFQPWIKDYYLFCISGHTLVSLQQTVSKFTEFVKQYKDMEPANALDFSYTVLARRQHYSPYRLAVVYRTFDDLYDTLSQWIVDNRSSRDIYYEKKSRKSVAENRDVEQGILSSIARYDMREIAEYYVNGYTIDFNRLFHDEQPRLIDVPGYCFTQSICWIGG
ncbi:beta-ketoacyl synthase N-terminal-like domain-containing protein [Paenibacillus apiarius]|uniref:Polyketide synthase n=1 Tax=Paenibacillus apiarius TaxID=46240 RepID=A0ABT4DXR2_9BACL|nr:polyketide synthase [Paenibacillus apiarius]MCY9517595.1 polyketide synthase [Paenibacillus apiarius]MCY9522145.1 polyketide synthase [Paenibacillus apiarius]MCY9554639.1 polyketide synthase [Paenibacillus apiarius]MCY9559215.1 polyketide synthase [Paenibacillus apiarius]MCY9683638.1 polyketide synthase [Paenibacillus apiarius]